MKFLYFSLIIIIFSACASEQKLTGSEKEYKITKSVSSFLHQFELATINHDKVKILSLLDKTYKKKRYSGLSKDEKEYFFREFYCGKDIKTNQTICPAFEEVDKIEFISIQQNSLGSYTIHYIIHTIYENLRAEWNITVTKDSTVLIYGIKAIYG